MARTCRLRSPRTTWLGFCDALEEVLIVGGEEDVLAGAEGIDGVEGGVGGAELVGEGHDRAEDLLLLLVGEIEARAGEQGPAGRDPKDDLAAGAGARGGPSAR